MFKTNQKSALKKKKKKKEKKMMIMLKQTTERPATPHNTELAASVVSKPGMQNAAWVGSNQNNLIDIKK